MLKKCWHWSSRQPYEKPHQYFELILAGFCAGMPGTTQDGRPQLWGKLQNRQGYHPSKRYISMVRIKPAATSGRNWIMDAKNSYLFTVFPPSLGASSRTWPLLLFADIEHQAVINQIITMLRRNFML